MALLIPGTLFACGLVIPAGPASSWSQLVSAMPWQFRVMAVTGGLATVAGIGDWIWHRRMGCLISSLERRIELYALAGGGVPLFVLMALASTTRWSAALLLPILALVLAITAAICYDEFVFHRKRCKWVETLLHRVLVLGNGAAWMAWMHWIYARGGGPDA